VAPAEAAVAGFVAVQEPAAVLAEDKIGSVMAGKPSTAQVARKLEENWLEAVRKQGRKRARTDSSKDKERNRADSSKAGGNKERSRVPERKWEARSQCQYETEREQRPTVKPANLRMLGQLCGT
jgi:hypothetical protein